MQDSDTGIDTTFNVSINCVPALQCIAIIGCTDLNNMTNNFESTSQIIELTLQLVCLFYNFYNIQVSR